MLEQICPYCGRKNHGLTARKIEILSMVAEGLTNRQIAQKLDRSEQTVKNHMTELFIRLKVKNRAEAVYRGVSLGILAKEEEVPVP